MVQLSELESRMASQLEEAKLAQEEASSKLEEQDENYKQKLLDKEQMLLETQIELEARSAEAKILEGRLNSSIFGALRNAVGNVVGGDSKLDKLKTELAQLKLRREQDRLEKENANKKLKLLEKDLDNQEKTACVICLDTVECDALFLPCGHNTTCWECGQNAMIRDCPMCRTRIMQKVKIYR